jgi:prepilin-type processing-associated H-X9-DG protein
VYVGGGLNAKTVPATAVVAYERLENHNGQGANVLYGDGHVEFIDKRSWSTIAAVANHPKPATQP